MMHFHATDQTDVPGELKIYLAKCGLSKRTINKCRLGTRLYHDLGIYGDIAEGFMEALADSYKVDLSSFVFDKYFPEEFQGNSWLTKFLTTYIPWGKYFYQRNKMYTPITLQMVLNSIRNGKFE